MRYAYSVCYGESGFQLSFCLVVRQCFYAGFGVFEITGNLYSNCVNLIKREFLYKISWASEAFRNGQDRHMHIQDKAASSGEAR